MTANIDAVATSDEIKATYRRYLQSLFAVRDPKIDAALRAAIDSTPMLDKGPYLEATPPYAPAVATRSSSTRHSVQWLRRSRIRCPATRPTAVRPPGAGDPEAGSGRNVVVATGTGSGKTEAFLLPILDSLMRERERGTLGLASARCCSTR